MTLNNAIFRIPLHKRGLILISITALLWSSSGLFIKILTLNAFQISTVRSAIAALTIYTLSGLRGKKINFEKDLISILCSVFYSGILVFFVLATKLTTAANAIFLQFTAPLYLLFLEPVFLKSKFSKRNLITVMLCLFGMVLFFFGKLEIGNIYGNLFAIIAGVCFAVFSLLLKMKERDKERSETLFPVVFGNVIVAIVCLPFAISGFNVNTTDVIILAYMGVFQIGISYMIFNVGIKYVSATEAMIFATLEALFNPVWVFLGIGEVPSVYAMAGGAIILGSIVIHNVTQKSEVRINS